MVCRMSMEKSDEVHRINHYGFRLIHREGQMKKFAKFLAETRGSKGVDEWDAMTFSHFQTYSHLAPVERAAGDNTQLEDATEYIEEIFEIRVSGKFKGQISQTEGLYRTPASAPAVNEAMVVGTPVISSSSSEPVGSDSLTSYAYQQQYETASASQPTPPASTGTNPRYAVAQPLRALPFAT
ncbi:hypothetical protein JAAARDRAFT_519149 [Jaapia argillacea MUCL 33604]|uniref:Uncharacterized protein n=1 Tax=Jaapia argillacea MUCL 33604 TaxID=933084 RepID=A0A067QGG0_9AGAM|nr:hypothetical protein JAAARDRAFT_519149 [Jaapia argillacea MUCL 33604]